MSETLGANVEQLDSLAERFSQAAETLRGIRSTLTVGVINNTGWLGPDADSVRASWDSRQMAIMLAANTLDRGARDLLAQARGQEAASDAGSGAVGGSTSGTGLPGTPAAATEDDFEETSKFTKYSRFAGPLLAPLGIYGGIHDMISPEHEGWRGAGDRAAGGLGAVASGGTLLLAAGMLGPVGAGIVVGAGLAAGAWALGNYVYDNWDGITEWTSHAWDATTDFAGDAYEGATDLAGDAWEGANNLADSVSEGVGDFVEDPVGSIGGLFS